jgi:peroxiredoxin
MPESSGGFQSTRHCRSVDLVASNVLIGGLKASARFGFSLVCAAAVSLSLLISMCYGRPATANRLRMKEGPSATPATDDPDALVAARKLEDYTADLAPPLRLSFRLQAAQALRSKYPDLANRFLQLSLGEILRSNDVTMDHDGLYALAVEAPADLAPDILLHLSRDYDNEMVTDLVSAHHVDAALALYRGMLSRGTPALDLFAPRYPQALDALLKQLADNKPAEAAKLFQEILAKPGADAPNPEQAWRMLELEDEVKAVAPGPAADACERIINTAADPGFGKQFWFSVTARVAIGSTSVKTADSRETLLILAAARLHALAPDRFEKVRPNLPLEWGDLTQPVRLLSRSFSGAPPNGRQPAMSPLVASFQAKIDEVTQGPAPGRSRAVAEVAQQVRALPASDAKPKVIEELAKLVSSVSCDNETLAAVATVMEDSLRDTSGPADAYPAKTYLDWALLRRYEAEPLAKPTPAMEAAIAVVEVRALARKWPDFALPGMDGKSYSLASLHGKVVLLYHWAPSCPPCRTEMSDLERLYRELLNQGLVVLAVTNEKRDVVAAFLQQRNYAFPTLLDQEEKMSSLFDLRGVPQTVILDREGHVVADVEDSRTYEQFRDLVRKAGLK